MGTVESETPKSVTNGDGPTGARQSRDLYREMKLIENPDFAHIPRETLESEIKGCVAEKSAPQGGDRDEENYDCETQNSGTLDELFIGMTRGSVYLWESGSVINWIARFDGYPTRKQAIQAAIAVYRAAEQWNEVLDGRVRFQYVTRFDDACFQVSYGGDHGGVLASAFFPTKWENSLNLLRVYKTQFAERNMPFIVNTMLHELGHILGLRHEHSHSGVPGWLPPEDRVNGPESVIWGSRNSKSVMAYYQGQEIQESDKKAICEAYDTLDNGKKISGMGKFGNVAKTIIRVKPNN